MLAHLAAGRLRPLVLRAEQFPAPRAEALGGVGGDRGDALYGVVCAAAEPVDARVGLLGEGFGAEGLLRRRLGGLHGFRLEPNEWPQRRPPRGGQPWRGNRRARPYRGSVVHRPRAGVGAVRRDRRRPQRRPARATGDRRKGLREGGVAKTEVQRRREQPEPRAAVESLAGELAREDRPRRELRLQRIRELDLAARARRRGRQMVEEFGREDEPAGDRKRGGLARSAPDAGYLVGAR